MSAAIRESKMTAAAACLLALVTLGQASAGLHKLEQSCPLNCSAESLCEMGVPGEAFVPGASQSGVAIKLPPLKGGTVGRIERTDRNLYGVTLDNTGPAGGKRLKVIRTSKVAPIQRKTIVLPVRVPKPKVIDSKCVCVQTVLKPRVCHHLITVPSVDRYIQISQRPVVEKFDFEVSPPPHHRNGTRFDRYFRDEAPRRRTSICIPVEMVPERTRHMCRDGAPPLRQSRYRHVYKINSPLS